MQMYWITRGVEKTLYYGMETGQNFSEVICGKLHYTKEARLVNIPKGQLAWSPMDNTAEVYCPDSVELFHQRSYSCAEILRR